MSECSSITWSNADYPRILLESSAEEQRDFPDTRRTYLLLGEEVWVAVIQDLLRVS